MAPGKNRRRVRSSKARGISPPPLSLSTAVSARPTRFNSHGELSDVEAVDAHAYRLDTAWQHCADDSAVVLSPSYQAAFTADPMQTGRIWRCGRVAVASRPDEAAEQQRRMFGGEDGDEGLNHLGITHDARPMVVESDALPPSSIPTSLRCSSPVSLPTCFGQTDAESSWQRSRISQVLTDPFPASLFDSSCTFHSLHYRHCQGMTADDDNTVQAAPRPHLGLRP